MWKNGDTGGVRKALAFSFVVLGLSSLVAQVLLVRELLGVFYGNEFFIGWTLFAWLAWTAAGALLAGRLHAGPGNSVRPLVICHALAAVLMPALLAGIRAGPTLLGGVPGAVPDLLPAMGFALAALAPLCLVLGAQFVFASRAWPGGERVDASQVLGRGYLLETAGFVAGGLLFSFYLVAARETSVAGLIGCLNAMAGFVLCLGFRDRSPGLRLALVAAVAVLVPAAVYSPRIERETAAWRFPGQLLVEARNSIYGNLAVTAIARQLNFYENGLLLGTEDEQLASEPLAHYPMLWHPDPRRVLLIGGGFNGALGEILKHGPEHVEYLELDPVLIDMAQRYTGAARRQALADPRVETIFADGRFYLARLAAAGSTGRYDVVLVNLPGPGTALISRFYSREFFRDVRRQLAPGGVLAVRLGFSPDYLGRELENLGAAIYQTLRAEFASVALLPEYEILFLATAGDTPAPAAADLVARYRQRGLKTDFVIPPAMEERLGNDRIGQVRAAFDANRTAQINRDSRPIACAYTFAYWLRSFHPRAAAFASRASAARWPWGAGLAGLALLGMRAALRRRPERLGPWAMGVGGFTLMACELVLLLGFQMFCGYLYHRLALILAALMLGMAIGTWLGTRCSGTATARRLAMLHALAAGYALAVAGILQLYASAGPRPPAEVEGLFLLLAAVIGGVAGFEFPAANGVYLAGAGLERKAGVVYGADLAGSCLGAMLIGLWALPVLGTATTLGILTALNAGAAVIARRQESASRPAPPRS